MKKTEIANFFSGKKGFSLSIALKNMKRETSAGGIVFRIKNNKPLILLITDHNNIWTFPKGEIEKNEDKVQAAKREVAEETGLTKISFVSNLPKIGYWYKRDGNLIRKTVYYFLFKAEGKEKLVPLKEEGINEVKWFLPEKALKISGYKKNSLKLLEKAIKKITSNL